MPAEDIVNTQVFIYVLVQQYRDVILWMKGEDGVKRRNGHANEEKGKHC